MWGLVAYLLAICMMKNCFKDVTELLIDLRLFYLKIELLYSITDTIRLQAT